MLIKVLPDKVVNKIAAGEVVDRPAAVVRELFDNAVDAGARQIIVEIESGGTELIRVVDDGCGMGRDDSLLAFERHATSKINDENDLESLDSMGFRGEALPSIAAVAKVRVRTREAESDTAHEVTFHGGVLKGSRPTPGPIGTEVEIRNLFFNVPARKKFLKSEKTEEQKIKSWLLQAALAQPQVKVSLVADGREIFLLPAAESFIERAKQQIRGSSVELYHESGPIEIEGVVAHPGMAQADTSALVVIVNRRVVSDKLIQRAVREGFDSMLKDREFPLGVINIRIPGTEVDVNVHPQKSEVRFRSHQAIFGSVRDAVQRAVLDFRGPPRRIDRELNEARIPEHAEQAAETVPTLRTVEARSFQERIEFSSGLRAVNSAAPFQPSQILPNLSQEIFRFSDLSYIGQALSCFLLCQKDEALFVVDMHAAHERCMYAKIRRGFDERSVVSQELLVPVSVALMADGVSALVARQELLEGFGIFFESFGQDSVLVRSAPPYLREQAIQSLIKEIAAIPEDEDPAGLVKERVDHISARIACHASVRSGETLTRQEVYALFENMDREPLSAACPHGRPVIAAFDRAEVEKWFGRDR